MRRQVAKTSSRQECSHQLPTRRRETWSTRRSSNRLVSPIIPTLAIIFSLWIVCRFRTENLDSVLCAADPKQENGANTTSNIRKSLNDPHASSTIDMLDKMTSCPDYGCPLFALEYDCLQNELQIIRDTDKDKIPSKEFNMAMMTRRGHIKTPPINQDVIVLLNPFRTAQTSNEHDFLLAIFDGHGSLGHLVAEYAAEAIPRILARKFNDFHKQGEQQGSTSTMDELDVRDALNATFIEADIDAPPIGAMDGGATASLTLRRGGKLYIANAGDSRTIIVSVSSDNQAEIPFMTRLDKPHLPGERSRIEQMGGLVKYPGNQTGQSRVWEYSPTSRETVGLAMSRSLGDWEFGAVGVIAEPLVNVIDTEGLSDAFVLAASDGMWDARKPIFFANQFAQSLSKQLQHPLLTCSEVIAKISPKNKAFYRDDISMIAMRILQ